MDRRIAVEERLTSVVQLQRVHVDPARIVEWREAASANKTALLAEREQIESPHPVVRLRLTDQTPLNWQIGRNFDLLQI